MFQQTYYHSLIKKYVILFGNMFTNTFIERVDADGNKIASIKVPIQYAPKDKMFTRLFGDPELDRQYSVLVPRMSFEITNPGFQYDSSRKLPSTNRYVVKDPNNANKVLYQYNPVPYNIFFTLYVYTKNVEDGLKIVEQIVPMFTPDWTPTVYLIPEMNDKRDIPIELTSGPIMTDVYENDFKKRRLVYWQLNFTMRAWFFGPVKKGPIIKYANTTIYAATSSIADDHHNIANTSMNEPDMSIHLTPGYTGSGPTTNAAASIPVSEIFLDDDFGFVELKEKL